MAESNILKQPFGLNIKVPYRTIQQGKDTFTQAANGVFEPLFNFLDENQNVFSGKIADEIEKYNLMAYNTGAVLRSGQPKKTFDIKG